MQILKFTEHEATAHKAIVVSFDLGGFSDFCNQPEAAIAAPRLIKRVFDVLNDHFYERDEASFLPLKTGVGKLPSPSFTTFTGDGAIMLWTLPKHQDYPQDFCNLVVAVMRNFQSQLMAELPSCEKQWRVHKLPKRARFGIATGIVYALRPPHTFTVFTDPQNYVGYCMNLAVRLQNHCPELGFLVHGHLHPEIPEMDRYFAVRMKGAQQEPVALFRQDLQAVSQGEVSAKFRPIK